MRVVTVSRRTDIPAFYAPWLLQRLRDGYCHVANPRSGAISRVALTPDQVAALGLFTRDPRPLLPHLRRLRAEGYRLFAHVTVNGYPKLVEPRSPSLTVATRSLAAVGAALGPAATVWRYDPVILGGAFDHAYHVSRFAQIAREVSGSVESCYISFVDNYRKTARNLAEAGISPAYELGFEHLELAQRFAEIGAEAGIVVRTCGEPGLSAAGLRTGACVDAELVWRLRPGLRLRPQPTREGCACAQAIDIGAYHTCAFGCAYCYATDTPALGTARLREHDPNDTILWRPAHLRGDDLDELVKRPAKPVQPQLF